MVAVERSTADTVVASKDSTAVDERCIAVATLALEDDQSCCCFERGDGVDMGWNYQITVTESLTLESSQNKFESRKRGDR
jgi:hypothetical protein